MSDSLPDELGVFYFRTILWNSGLNIFLKNWSTFCWNFISSA